MRLIACLCLMAALPAWAAPDIDLVMTAVSTPVGTATRGGYITVDDTVKNQGTAATETTFGNISVGYYLSTDATITAADTFLGNRLIPASLAGGASGSSSQSVYVPATLAPGTYYLGAIADRTGIQVETNESNNALAGAPIQIAAPAADALPAPRSVRPAATTRKTILIARKPAKPRPRPVPPTTPFLTWRNTTARIFSSPKR
jgi:hypothetical protein